jgi:hypothetical protein
MFELAALETALVLQPDVVAFDPVPGRRVAHQRLVRRVGHHQVPRGVVDDDR